ncbi:hypothetical protein INT43_004734 [Umbelopsis isabellina]|uniref:Uncharacterized protein n=1 Tax=Mortierella isabellina TaxID=91625 RepID=A0A8H7U8J4_MORIS|nr:hypothetical protein INT43_004734 [Umbelopsis isabellina]
MQYKLLAITALLSATAWAAPTVNSTDGDAPADVKAADNSTSADGVAAASYSRSIHLSVYDDKYFNGREQEWTNYDGYKFPCWKIDLDQVRSYKVNTDGVDVRFYEDEGCENMARAFEDSDWDHIWDDDVKKSKWVKVVRVWGA